MHCLWAFRRLIRVPLSHIRSVRPADQETMTWKSLRLLGTHLPGVITAGTLRYDGLNVFWDVCSLQNAIAVELDGEFYDRLVVEVGDPRATLALFGHSVPS